MELDTQAGTHHHNWLVGARRIQRPYSSNIPISLALALRKFDSHVSRRTLTFDFGHSTNACTTTI